ncbi:hypothetical protein Ae201684P_009475 [Aphanomyces euteiches]|uniref:Uncharacterized protein n=1 Tax=Aphanomyces euteiches TaxID=100861 RepID=A0A6G0WL02_9STRA|nr:hypothetical protein Ae201684_014091 [Aphanomyces euteiches]KAH9096240.1 hypothetical protein Ae201684P_009475 [Aphanomyces euteiches]KAH9155379.1 hypothetical protein AeRB84_002637 [Aphanomyces euteiches]
MSFLRPPGGIRLNKVPIVTLPFWVAKICATTIGETFSMFLIHTLNLGNPVSIAIIFPIFLVVFASQLRLDKYVPAVYWLTITIGSVLGTLIADQLGYEERIPMWIITTIFGVPYFLVLIMWYKFENTLSFEAVATFRRENFYWLAVLISFPFGTAAGDFIAEDCGFGYFHSFLVFASILCLFIGAWYYSKNKYLRVVTFWIAYIMTRPFGTVMGDWLTFDTSPHDVSEPKNEDSSGSGSGSGSSSGSGGVSASSMLGLGMDTWSISSIDAVIIVVLVIYFTATKRDVLEQAVAPMNLHSQSE